MSKYEAESGLSIDDAFEAGLSAAHALWSSTTRRIRLFSFSILFTTIMLLIWRPNLSRVPEVPAITLKYPHSELLSPFNVSKVALLVENRPLPILAPLILHFMSVIPPDWRFRFMGSLESVAAINNSVAIQQAVNVGKLDLTYIPANMSTSGQEMISRFLTNLWIYETVLQPAEWLLLYQADSILCANSKQTLNDYLEFDWVGAPWNPGGKFGGNGGLSLRKVSTIIDILRHQARPDNSQPEDVWLTDRLGHRPGAKLANGTASLTFSGEMYPGNNEQIIDSKVKKGKGKHKTTADSTDWVKGIDDWRDGFYEPMGYHTGGSGVMLHSAIWGTPEMRGHIYNYCPEVKMTLAMDAAQYVPGDCGNNWKRGLDVLGIDENSDDWPLIPPGLVPW